MKQHSDLVMNKKTPPDADWFPAARMAAQRKIL